MLSTILILGALFKIGGVSVGIGGLLAALLSWTRNSSVVWSVIHFFLGWFYVIHWLLTGGTKKT